MNIGSNYDLRAVSEPMLLYHSFDPREHTSMKFDWNSNFLCQEIPYENFATEILMISFMPESVDTDNVEFIYTKLRWVIQQNATHNVCTICIHSNM